MASSYSKTSLFVRPYVNEKPAFTKLSALESVFLKDAFSLAVFHRISVDGKPNWSKKITFFKQTQTRVDGALDTVHAYGVIFKNGESAQTKFSSDKNARFRKRLP